MRFYEVNGGDIRIDGIPTTKLTRANLRSNFGMVLQDTWLFAGTIAENIAYGKEDATREEIEQAAKMARVDYFIKTLPQGYDTPLDNDADNILFMEKGNIIEQGDHEQLLKKGGAYASLYNSQFE